MAVEQTERPGSIKSTVQSEIRIAANARLHMGFLDLNGGLGRQFGSLGVALDGIDTRLTLRLTEDSGQSIDVIGSDADRIESYAKATLESFGANCGVSIKADSIITPHAGLGSGTQLALAVGIGISRLLGRNDSAEQIAIMLGRGKRSSIGIGTFSNGGFVLDGGKGRDSLLSPVLSRLHFPEDWRIILLLDHEHKGVFGPRENTAFRELPPLPDYTSAHLCRLALMKLLPGLVETDMQAFGEAVTEIQQLVGDHFAPVQGGRFASPAVAALLERFRQAGAVGFGQSSWGPTGFVLCPGQKEASEWISTVKAGLTSAGDVLGTKVEIRQCQATNTAGKISSSV